SLATRRMAFEWRGSEGERGRLGYSNLPHHHRLLALDGAGRHLLPPSSWSLHTHQMCALPHPPNCITSSSTTTLVALSALLSCWRPKASPCRRRHILSFFHSRRWSIRDTNRDH